MKSGFSSLHGTLGGFTAIATITRARIDGGLHDNGKPYVGGYMEMEGKLIDFHYGSLKQTLRQKTSATVLVRINFMENPQEDTFGWDGTKYIGFIQEWEKDKQVRAIVAVNLPISMYPTLQSLKREEIRIDTVHDLFTDENVDSIVAFIKRIYFEIQPVEEDEGSGKKFSISIG